MKLIIIGALIAIAIGILIVHAAHDYNDRND